MKVTLDTDKIKGKKLTDLSMEQVQELMDDSEEQAIDEIAAEEASLTLGAIGAPYKIGPIDISIAVGHLVLLNEIDSPFVSGDIGEEGEELNTTDCIKSLYVLANGEDAIRPIMAIQQRVKTLMMLKPMVEKDKSMFDALLDRAESIADAHIEFELEANRWYTENFAGHDFQTVIEDAFAAIHDVVTAAGDMPTGESKKKL
jgi:hypothetical protein